ncbi:F-box/RNI-like/FBD-like domains-containing protein [Rhynchospora pubera]|uniref:F-box/RNI-like/FBD-like domains-containing protein n=1 Tax=Rhynchospora pubera TaxID=906938 RepID=A0AAV8D1E2_9POAL|nr:F-box/RNI-like/FBD-like domains-containing protein [Rhynchospora pubera]
MPNIDRISNLPDHLLQHILSLLDSREAVRTCLLSKRWKKLWVGMHSLDLNICNFKTQTSWFQRTERITSFQRFVNVLLSRRDPSDLHTFRLFCQDYNVSDLLITAWTFYALRFNAKVIEMTHLNYTMLPADIFTCASVEELYLDISEIGIGIVAGGVNLPRLRKLHLYDVFSGNNGILRELLSGCPALEELKLDECKLDISVISSLQLKYLYIYSGLDMARIESIRAPNLVSLDLQLLGDELCAANFEEMPFLANVSITVFDGTGFDAKCRIISACPNVRNLKLHGRVMKDLLSTELPKCPTFFNLRKLQLYELCRTCHGDLVDGMLEHSPNLKKLELRTRCHPLLNSQISVANISSQGEPSQSASNWSARTATESQLGAGATSSAPLPDMIAPKPDPSTIPGAPSVPVSDTLNDIMAGMREFFPFDG